MRETLSNKMGAETITAQTSATLRGLEHKVPNGEAKNFLKEMVDCFEVGANRAAILMAWILAKNTDRRVKVGSVSHRDDFIEMPESKFIEFVGLRRSFRMMFAKY